MTRFNPNLLPESADSQDSERHENVNMLHLLVPCHEEGILHQWCKDDNVFIIYDCSPEYREPECDSFKGTLLVEADGSYSWWRSIIQGENKDE